MIEIVKRLRQLESILGNVRRLTSPDRNVQIAAARAWSVWEGSTLSLVQDPERVRLFGADNYAIAFARIECHYFINRGFFERDDQLLRGVEHIRHLPCTMVHGRYDVVTPVKNAWDLARAEASAWLRGVSTASSLAALVTNSIPADVTAVSIKNSAGTVVSTATTTSGQYTVPPGGTITATFSGGTWTWAV